MALRSLLLLALVGAVACSAGHGVHHLTTDTFAEAVGDGKVGASERAAEQCRSAACSPAEVSR